MNNPPPFWQGLAAAFMREVRDIWFYASALAVAAILSTYFTGTGWFAP